ncbi:MAG: APC family permease [Acidobacteriota bacterium]
MADRSPPAGTPHRFGLRTLIALVIGNAIGAGVFTTSGFALADLGSRSLVLWAWAVGGLVALLGATSYGLLAQHLTESGGEYLYLSRSIHPLAGFIGGYVSLLAGFTGAIALAASTFEAYARAALPDSVFLASLPAGSLAIGSIVLGGAVQLVRSDLGGSFHDLVVALMLSGLLLFSAGALAGLVTGRWAVGAPPSERTSFDLAAFAGSLVWISLSYSGFNAAVYVAGEARDARRNVPRAMILGTTITMIFYLVLNAVFVFAPDATQITGRPEVAAIAAEAIGGSFLRHAVELLIAASLLTSVTAMTIAGPRVYAKMAEDGALPRWLRAREGAPPRSSIALQVVLALLVVSIAGLRDLLSYLGFTLSLCLALAVGSLFVRHLRRGERPTSWTYPWAPALFLLSTLGFAGLSASRQPAQLVALAMVVGVGTLAWFLSLSGAAATAPDLSEEGDG